MLKHYRNRILQGAALAFAVFVVLLALADVRAMLDALADFPLWLFGPLLALKLVNYTSRYAQWHYLLGIVGVRVRPGVPSGPAPPTLRLRDSIAIFVLGFPMAISPGKVGELLKSAIVKNLTDVPIARTAPVVLTERIVDGIAVLLIIGGAVVLGGGAVIQDVQGVDAATIRGVILFTVAAMAAGLGVVRFRVLSLGILDILARVPVLGRAEPWLREFYLSSYQLLRWRRLSLTVGFGVVAYGTDCLALYIMLRGLGVADEGLLLLQASFALGFTVIVAALSAMPGGAGARELSLTALLTGIIGATSTVAHTATVMNTFFQVALGIFLGVGVGIIFRGMLFAPGLETALREDGAPQPSRAI